VTASYASWVRATIGPVRAPSRRAPGFLAAAVGVGALIIRLALHGNSFDLFGDEVIYNALGRSVATGGLPRFGNQVFLLHGPGFFYLEGAWQRLFGDPAGLMAQIYQMRMLNALLAGVTAVVMVLLAARLGSQRSAAAAGLLFALDPFCIRQNDRVLLETAMMLWVLLGYLVFLRLATPSPVRHAGIRAVGSGLLFGCAVLTKDEAVLLTILPLTVAAVLQWVPPRLAALSAGATVLVYAVYAAVVAANGYAGALWQAKTAGVLRLLGLLQSTGFHSSGGGSLSARLIAEGLYFGTTYAVLALALPAVVLLLRRRDPLLRLMALFYCAAAATLGYALTLGTLEEQELYLLIIPSLLIIPVAVFRLREDAAGRGLPRAAVRTVLVLALSLNAVTCVQWLRQPDDGFARLLSYMAAQVPAGARVSDATGEQNDVAEYALAGRYDAGLWLTPSALALQHVPYIVAEWAEIDEGYSSLSSAQVRKLTSSGRVVFSFHGRTYGDLQLYRLPASREGN
jgi:4-amino-4-deoxy-L-arabinose transferase-like glycosyltransferase